MYIYKSFVKIMSIIITFIIALLFCINYLYVSKNVSLMLILNYIVIILSILFLCSIFFSLIVSYMVLKKVNLNPFIMRLNFNIVTFFYLPMNYLCKYFRVSKEEIRRMYIILNNEHIFSKKYTLDANYIMIMTPHCIQKSSCTHKITTNIENCKKCGQCRVNNLIELKEKYNIKLFVATGGTLARKIIKENKPKAIIAVACERDLMSGIRDVKGIPVIGILNERPNGPCFNTNVDICKVEDAIKFFLGGE